MSEPILELRDVSGGYGRGEVLRSIDLIVGAGERLAVVGPNGAGKSTLLRLMTGLLAPSSGAVLVGGRPLRHLGRDEIARRIAVVPQIATLPFSARVEEIVALGRLPHEDSIRGPRPADRAAVAAAIERVGLGRLVGRDARELSLGERQLVLLAVAVAQASPIIVLDEPTVHLDIRHQIDVMELLADLNARDGRTIVTVLHDLNLAARSIPRIVVVAEGRLVSDGPPDEALNGRTIREVFRVDPAALPAGPWTRTNEIAPRGGARSSAAPSDGGAIQQVAASRPEEASMSVERH